MKEQRGRIDDCLAGGSWLLAAAVALLMIAGGPAAVLAAGGGVGALLYGSLQRFGRKILVDLSNGNRGNVGTAAAVVLLRYAVLAVVTVAVVRKTSRSGALLLFVAGVSWYYLCEAGRSLFSAVYEGFRCRKK